MSLNQKLPADNITAKQVATPIFRLKVCDAIVLVRDAVSKVIDERKAPYLVHAAPLFKMYLVGEPLVDLALTAIIPGPTQNFKRIHVEFDLSNHRTSVKVPASLEQEDYHVLLEDRILPFLVCAKRSEITSSIKQLITSYPDVFEIVKYATYSFMVFDPYIEKVSTLYFSVPYLTTLEPKNLVHQ